MFIIRNCFLFKNLLTIFSLVNNADVCTKKNQHSNTDPLGSQVPAIHFYSHLYNFQLHGDSHVIFCKTCCIPDYNQIHKNRIRRLNDDNSINSIYIYMVLVEQIVIISRYKGCDIAGKIHNPR